MKLEFSTDVRKVLRYQISWKPVYWEQSCSMRTDGRKDTTKLIVAFRNFVNAPEICVLCDTCIVAPGTDFSNL
jgi:hypothetical protein